MKFYTVDLTLREYRRLLRQRGKERTRQLYNRPCWPLFNYWFDWECIRSEWEHVRCGQWQQETVRRAYRQRLQAMRQLRPAAQGLANQSSQPSR